MFYKYAENLINVVGVLPFHLNVSLLHIFALFKTFVRCV